MLQTIVDFLRTIGIAACPGTVASGSFLPALRIVNGALEYDPHGLRWPGDLLHEAGHIAVTPAEHRAGLSDALAGKPAWDHGGELEAMAWSWAATLHLGLPPEALFHPDGYKGQSPGLLFSYRMGVCPGALGLSRTGMTLLAQTALGARLYPHMQRWLR